MFAPAVPAAVEHAVSAPAPVPPRFDRPHERTGGFPRRALPFLAFLCACGGSAMRMPAAAPPAGSVGEAPPPAAAQAPPVEIPPAGEPCALVLPQPQPFVGRPPPLRSGHARSRWLNRGDEECFDGDLPYWHVKERLVAVRGLFRACYTDRLQRLGDLAGRVEVSFTVDEAGTVLQPQVESNDTGDPPLGDCLVRVVAGLSFLCNHGAVHVRYPIAFMRGD